MLRRSAVLFPLLLGALIGVGLGFEIFPALILLVAGILVLAACWYAPLVVGTAALACAPFIGWLFSFRLSPGGFAERAFGGSIDVPLADLAAFLGILSVVTWAMRHLVLRDVWRRLPFPRSYLALVAAHLASAFSTARPDPVGIVKFAMRPVAFSYVAFVALPVLLLRRWQDVRRSYGLFVLGAAAFAVQGAFSLFVDAGFSILSLQRARPLPLLGTYPIGMNHNVLAEWLVVAAPFALALACWTHDARVRRWCWAAAGLCLAVALLTFARSAWIVIALQLVVACATVWRARLGKAWGWVVRLGWALALPLAAYMAWFSLRAEVATSTDARAMLTGIAWRAFLDHPLVGIGAGTFANQVGGTWGYRLLFGGAMDAHGVLQKVLAETGLVGTAAYLLVSSTVFGLAWRAVRRIGWSHRIGLGLAYAGLGVLGAWTYQLFNTTYWSAKLWLPIGLFFAAAALCRRPRYV